MPSADREPYSYLLEHIPSWFTILETVNQGTPQRQLDAPNDAVDLPKAANDASVATLPRNNNSDAAADASLEALDGRPLSPRAEETQNSTAKRKRGSNYSAQDTAGSQSPATVRNKYRERNAKLVLFDKEAQNQFETIVGGIAACKNIIRKTKATARMSDFGRKAAAIEQDNADEDSGDTSESIDADKILAEARARRGTSGSSSTGRTAQNLARQKADVLDQTDKTLLQAQDLCENAAFQLLRDGDCRIETKFIKDKLQDLLATAKNESARLMEEHAKDRSRRASMKSQARSTDGENAEAGAVGRENDMKVAQTTDVRLSIDDDDDDEDMPLPPIRLTSKMRS